MKDNVDKFIESLSELNNEIKLMTSLMVSDLKPSLEELSLLISKQKIRLTHYQIRLIIRQMIYPTQFHH